MSDRVETGPLRFGDDWTGYFLRGDSAAGILAYWHVVQDAIARGVAPDPIALANVRWHFEGLTGSREQGSRPPAQVCRPWAECQVEQGIDAPAPFENKSVPAMLILVKPPAEDQARCVHHAPGMKWKITGKASGTVYGSFEADDAAGAMEALAQDIAKADDEPIERVRAVLAEGSYTIEPEAPAAPATTHLPAVLKAIFAGPATVQVTSAHTPGVVDFEGAVTRRVTDAFGRLRDIAAHHASMPWAPLMKVGWEDDVAEEASRRAVALLKAEGIRTDDSLSTVTADASKTLFVSVEDLIARFERVQP